MNQAQQTPPAQPAPNLSPVRLFCEKYPGFKPGGVRALIFNEDKNGLKKAGAIKRVGRKVLIDEANFWRWIDEQNGVQA